MKIDIKLDRDFEEEVERLRSKYGSEFEMLNGFHPDQLNFTEFIDNFIDSDNTANGTIDANANVLSKDIVNLLNEMPKSHMKLLGYNKVFYEMKKEYGLKRAREALEAEWKGDIFIHNGSDISFRPYCFSGDTKFITNLGIKRLDECVGKQISVLNKNLGWEKATVKNFGIQPLRELTLTRNGSTRVIYVTGNHRWFVRSKNNNVPMSVLCTDELRPGMRIPVNTCKTWTYPNPSPFGVAHGFFYGDGDKGVHRMANFCGDKDSLLPYFTPANVTGSDYKKTTRGIPNYFCELPDLTESKDYLYGWLSGYFAADGCIDTDGRCSISSEKEDDLRRVQDIMAILGMPIENIRYQDRVSNLTGEMGRVYCISLSHAHLRSDFFIRPLHKKIWEATKDNNTRGRNWIVKSVRTTDREEEVYCAVTEYTQSFTLDGNILTHNCFNYDLSDLATRGMFFISNLKTAPAQHLSTFCDHLLETVSWVSNRQSGASGIANVLMWMFYFWRKDVDNNYFVKSPEQYRDQCFQKFIYDLNMPYLRIAQCA